MNFVHEENNWQELTRRLEAIPGTPTPEDAGIVVRAIPVNDPSGFVELAETMGREHRERGISLAAEFPFFESFFSPILPWQKGAAEAYAQVDELLRRAISHVSPLMRGSDYEVFNDAGGEVTAFHFKSANDLRAFREAIGLDGERGFAARVDEMRR